MAARVRPDKTRATPNRHRDAACCLTSAYSFDAMRQQRALDPGVSTACAVNTNIDTMRVLFTESYLDGRNRAQTGASMVWPGNTLAG